MQDRTLPHTGQIDIVLVLMGRLPLNLLQNRSAHLFQLILSHSVGIEIDRSQCEFCEDRMMVIKSENHRNQRTRKGRHEKNFKNEALHVEISRDPAGD